MEEGSKGGGRKGVVKGSRDEGGRDGGMEVENRGENEGGGRRDEER